MLASEDAKDLRELYSLLRTYAQEHNGKYPPSLQLFIKDAPLREGKKNRLKRYRYVRGLDTNDRGSWPLAYSPRSNRSPYEKLLLLRVDGTIEAEDSVSARVTLGQELQSYLMSGTKDALEGRRGYDLWLTLHGSETGCLLSDLYYYALDHDGNFPPDLPTLVREGYTPTAEDLNGASKRLFVPATSGSDSTHHVSNRYGYAPGQTLKSPLSNILYLIPTATTDPRES